MWRVGLLGALTGGVPINQLFTTTSLLDLMQGPVAGLQPLETRPVPVVPMPAYTRFQSAVAGLGSTLSTPRSWDSRVDCGRFCSTSCQCISSHYSPSCVASCENCLIEGTPCGESASHNPPPPPLSLPIIPPAPVNTATNSKSILSELPPPPSKPLPPSDPPTAAPLRTPSKPVALETPKQPALVQLSASTTAKEPTITSKKGEQPSKSEEQQQQQQQQHQQQQQQQQQHQQQQQQQHQQQQQQHQEQQQLEPQSIQQQQQQQQHQQQQQNSPQESEQRNEGQNEQQQQSDRQQQDNKPSESTREEESNKSSKKQKSIDDLERELQKLLGSAKRPTTPPLATQLQDTSAMLKNLADAMAQHQQTDTFKPSKGISISGGGLSGVVPDNALGAKLNAVIDQLETLVSWVRATKLQGDIDMTKSDALSRIVAKAAEILQPSV